MKKYLLAFLIALLVPLVVNATPSSVDRVTDHIQPLIMTDYLKGSYYVATSTTIASTLPYASTTALSTTAFWITGQAAGCAQFNSSAKLISTGVNCGTGSAASSTLLVDNNTFSGNNLFSASTTFSTLVNINQASTSLSTVTGTQYFSNITNSLLATDNTGKVIASTTLGTSLLSGSLGSVNGVTFNAGSSITVASTTLLSNNNTFSGNNQFTASTTMTKVLNLANASSSLTTLGTTWFASLTSALLGTDQNGMVVATTSVGVNYLTGILPTTKGGTGTSTWLTGSIPYFNGSNFTENNSNLFWDNTNTRLGIATSTPGTTFSIGNVANFTSATSTFYGNGFLASSTGNTSFNFGVAPPTQGAAAVAGANLNLWAAAATAGTGAGGANGGNVFIRAGDGSRNISGGDNGGAITLTGGMGGGVGGSVGGAINILSGAGQFGTNAGGGAINILAGGGTGGTTAGGSVIMSSGASAGGAGPGSMTFAIGGVGTTTYSAAGLWGISTTTPFWALTVASSSGPQLALVDTTTSSNAWTLRSISNNLYLATSSALATSTVAAFHITNNGDLLFSENGTSKVGIATTSPGTVFSIQNVVNFHSATSSFYSTGGINLTGGGCFAINNTCVGGSSISAANPTASIGLSTVNGSAGTFMRSDAAPALSQGITPTWTGLHIFSSNASSTLFSIQGGTLPTLFVGATATSTIVGDNATSTLYSSLGVTKTSGTAFRVNDAFGTNILNVSTASTTSGYDLLELWSATSTGPLFAFDQYGHMTASSTTPTLSSCGTSPSLSTDSSDFQGTITVGGVAATACTLTFGTPHTTGTHCVISEQTGSVVNAASYTESLTSFTYSQTGLTSDKLDYICTGK